MADFAYNKDLATLRRQAQDDTELTVVFRRVLERLTQTTNCRHPRLIWYPEHCPLPPGDGSIELTERSLAHKAVLRHSVVLEDFPKSYPPGWTPLFSLPLQYRRSLYGRLEIFELKQDRFEANDRDGAESFADLLITIISEWLSHIDATTGLYNKGYFQDQLTKELDNGTVSLVMVDIDHFKQVNDNYGHTIGDVALRIAAMVMQSVVEKGFAARYGGEELVLVLPGTNLQEAAQQAERARTKLAASNIPVPERELSFQITASFGVSESVKHGFSPLQLVTAADEALYVAKDKGRNAVYLAGKPPARYSSIAASLVQKKITTTKPINPEPKLIAHPPKSRIEERRKTKPPLPSDLNNKPEIKKVLDSKLQLRKRLASGKTIGAYNLTRNTQLPFSRLCPSPYAVDVKDEELFVIDFHRSQVHSLSSRQLMLLLRGRSQRLPIKTVSNSLRGPVAVTRDDLGYLCVLDSQNHEVRKFSNDGTPGRIYGGIGNGRGELSRPQDVVYDGEKLIVADMDNRRIQAYGFSKRVEFEVGLQSHSGGVMPKPEKLALAADGRIYVLDTANSRIVIYSNTGEYQNELTDYGSQLGQLRSPVDLTITAEGVLIVAEGGDNNRLQFFDLELNSLGKLELGAILLSNHRLKPLAPTRRDEPNVQSLRPGSLAGNTLKELYLIDQNTGNIFLLEI